VPVPGIDLAITRAVKGLIPHTATTAGRHSPLAGIHPAVRDAGKNNGFCDISTPATFTRCYRVHGGLPRNGSKIPLMTAKCRNINSFFFHLFDY